MSDALRIERVEAGRIRVAGALGFAEAGNALKRGDDLFAGDPRVVEVDVAGLQHVDSATLAVLLAWAARAAARGVRLRLAGVPTSLQALAHLCDAEPLLGIA